jgi:hypothetical protein
MSGFRLLAVTPLWVFAGCAHYYLPANQLDSPETIGPDRIGRLELVGIQSGTDLLTPASPQSPDPKTGKTPDPVLSLSPVNYAFGVSVAITPELDLGIKIQPFAPFIARAQYQLSGAPESKAEAGNLSLSAGVSGGLLVATYNGENATFYSANAALIGGWRFARHHIASLAPFFSLAGISGVGTASGNGTRFGAGLGYQYDVEALIIRAELTYASGTIAQESGAANAGGFFPGLLMGLKL